MPTAAGLSGRDATAGSEPAVVIVTWNSARDIAACLASVRRPGREILVIDNGSADDTAAIVAREAPQAVWVPLGSNRGFAVAANEGLRRATSEFVLVLNPDARTSEAALAESIDVLRRRPEVGLVSPAQCDETGAVVPTVDRFPRLRELTRRRWSERCSAPTGAREIDVEWCHGAHLLGRRGDLLALGGFEERFFLYGEDMDLCWRVHEKGRRVVYLPDVAIVHAGNRSGEQLLGSERPAAILAGHLEFVRLRWGRAAELAWRGAATGFFGARALARAIAGQEGGETARSLACVAWRGPRPHPARVRAAAWTARAQAGRVGSAKPDAAEPGAVGGPVAPPSLLIAVPARASEPGLAATLRSLQLASTRLLAVGFSVRMAIAVNGIDELAGEGSSPALDDARAFASSMKEGLGVDVEVLVDPVADKARAWNRLRALCTEEWIAFCDADVEVERSALLRLAEHLRARPGIVAAVARQVPRSEVRASTWAARAAALPYRFDFGVVGGRLYLLRASAVTSMPEGLRLEDGWLTARLGPERIETVNGAEVAFRSPETLGDLLRERVRTEAGKIQLRNLRRSGLLPDRAAIATYPWQRMLTELRGADLAAAALAVAVRGVARIAAEAAMRSGREVAWQPTTTTKGAPLLPVGAEIPLGRRS